MPEVDGEKIYSFAPSILSTPERWRARFNAIYQAEHIIQCNKKYAPTADDLNKYAMQFPEEGDKLSRMNASCKVAGIGSAIGLVGGAAYLFRVTKSTPLLIGAVALSTLTGNLVGSDIGSWVYGTYKFDAGATNERYAQWVCDVRQTASE